MRRTTGKSLDKVKEGAEKGGKQATRRALLSSRPLVLDA